LKGAQHNENKTRKEDAPSATCILFNKKQASVHYIHNTSNMPTATNSMGLGDFIGGNKPADGSMSEFDLLSAPAFHDSNGELDDFEPTPIQSNNQPPQKSMPQTVTPSLADVAMFEPTPLRTDSAPAQRQQQTPAVRQMIDSQGFPVTVPAQRSRSFRAPQHQQPQAPTSMFMNGGHPQQQQRPMVENHQLQAAIQSLRHAQAMKEHQAHQAEGMNNGLNASPMHQQQHHQHQQRQVAALQMQRAAAAAAAMQQAQKLPHAPMHPLEQQHSNTTVTPMPTVHQGMNNPTAMQQLHMRHQQQQYQQQQNRVAPMPQIQQSMNPMHVQSRSVQPMPIHQPMTEVSNNNHNITQIMSRQQQHQAIPQQHPQQPGQQQPGNLKAYSVAMEKLCETMKRSAQSRNMVKQLSGRNLTEQGSQRSLGSGRRKALSREGSFQGLDSDSLGSSGHSRPSRRSIHDTKHRIIRDAAPGRGIYRHNSSSSLVRSGNGNANRASMQFDDHSYGHLLGDADTVSSGDTRFSGKTV
jgi:hypothetical protein